MDPIMGSIVLFAGNYAPQGWALCDGHMLQIAANTALFSILGTSYGGDGQTTFALPNLSAPSENGPQYIIAVEGVYPSRD
jgi:microcystin-dependent protein